jgi:hypothetical protein
MNHRAFNDIEDGERIGNFEIPFGNTSSLDQERSYECYYEGSQFRPSSTIDIKVVLTFRLCWRAAQKSRGILVNESRTVPLRIGRELAYIPLPHPTPVDIRNFSGVHGSTAAMMKLEASE